ncbi:MAG: 4Fe-4S binding protein [Halobacteriota archaeon]|nr:4Fe-4S binding protein [Halobacteriota archaeon]
MAYQRPRPVIDYNLCTGCGSCINVCPRGAIAIMNIEKEFNTISGLNRPNTSLKNKIERIEEDLINVKRIIEKIERR